MNAGGLKAAELRIGNWVRSKDWRPNDGAGAFNYTPEFFEIDGRHLSEFEYFKNLIEPIPLNEDWLIRAGFRIDRVDEFSTCYCAKEFDFYLHIAVNGEITMNIQPDGAANMKYVHQLQNLYMCLTGRELEITDTQTT